MALSTKNIKLSEGKQSKTINPGNTVAKIYDMSLKPGYNEGSYYLLLNIETEPIDGFEGFFIDAKDESKGRHLGQVGRVRSGQYAYETKTLPSGAKVDRDENILKALMTIATAQGKRDDLDNVGGNTIEEFVNNAKEVICNDIYLNFCIVGKEYTNKEGYIAYDLFLPKSSGKKYAFSADVSTVLTYDEKTHILPEKKKTTESVSEFEPQTPGNDFDMF